MAIDIAGDTKEGKPRQEYINEGVKIAMDMAEFCVKKFEEIVNVVKKCLEELERRNIHGTLYVFEDEKKIQKWSEDNKGNKNIIFIVFSQSGHVVVVGMGANDLCFSDDNNGNDTTSKIMKQLEDELKEKWDPKSLKPWEWNKEQAIVISFPGLDVEKTKLKKGDSILQCMKGIENYIGDELLKSDIPILNARSHRNYKHEYWVDLESKGYILP